MSQFDNGKTPAYVPQGAHLIDNGDAFNIQEGNKLATVLLAAGTSLSASTAMSQTNNFNCRGALFALNVASVPGSGSTTIALKVNFVDAVGGGTLNIASRAAVSASGSYVFMVYPGLSASAGGVSSVLPRNFSVQLSLSTGATSKECVLSLTMTKIA